MKTLEKKLVLGLLADEQAMFEILEKFLSKEGYLVKQVSKQVASEEGFAAVIYAPTRHSERLKSIFENLKCEKILIVQSGDEEYAVADDHTIVLSDRPLNLRQLGEMIKRIVSNSDYSTLVH